MNFNILPQNTEFTEKKKIRAYLKKNQHKSLFDDANTKAKAGITTDAEVKRELGVIQG